MRRTVLLFAALHFTIVPSARADDAPRYAGPTAKGFLLPNGWTITPAGDQISLSDLPLNIVPLADGKHVLVASNGYNKHELVLVELGTKGITSRASANESWFGLAATPNGERVWWSGAGSGLLHTFACKDGTLTRMSADGPDLSKMTREELAARREKLAKNPTFKSGLVLDRAGEILYSLDMNAHTISALRADNGALLRQALCGKRPYDVVMTRDGTQLYVSDWADRCVLVVRPDHLRTVYKIPVGEHPNQLVVHPNDGRVFVACASSNCVSVIEPKRGIVTETIVTSLFPRAPEGSTPDALAVSPDGKTLYVANADNNCVVVVDVSTPNRSQVNGFIPTGWYPTAVAVSRDGKHLFVGVGKGNQTRANPIDKKLAAEAAKAAPGRRLFPYIGTTLSGALSIVPLPDEKQLAAYTETVYRNCPYSDQLLTGAPYRQKTAIPTRVGDPSPIKHVIYIIKENRTYDQVFGDLKKGNGDPSLVMFGENVTPNHHKLANEFVLLDNLYCNGQVSRDGHPWSTMAYNTDYIARDWMLTYSRRTGVR